MEHSAAPCAEMPAGDYGFRCDVQAGVSSGFRAGMAAPDVAAAALRQFRAVV